MSTGAEPNVFYKIINKCLEGVFNIHSLIPDSILFGSTVLYFLTQHLAYGVFAIFILEIMGAYRAIMFIITRAFKSSIPVPSERTPSKKECVSGFTTPSVADPDSVYLDKFNDTMMIPYSMYCITAMITYLLSAIVTFKDVLAELGSPCDTQYYLAFIFCTFFFIASLACRWWFCGMESIPRTMISIVIGVAVGIGFYYLNLKMFDTEGMNFLGLPLLVKNNGDIRICGPA
jgi:hypothetical protein